MEAQKPQSRRNIAHLSRRAGLAVNPARRCPEKVRFWLCQEDVKASCCVGDERRPFGAALQGEASNNHKVPQ